MRMGRSGEEHGGRGPFRRFTAQARAVFNSAQVEAEQLGHDYLGTEHLLLGLFATEDGVIAKVLNNLELKRDEIRSRVVEVAGEGGHKERGRMGFTPRVRQVFQGATREAMRLNHRYVAPEHLLLGLAGAEGSVAYRILTERGVTLERARAEVIAVLASTGPVETEPGDDPAGTTVVMCRVDDRALGALDTLIEAGICSTRSDAASWLIQAGIESNTSLFEAIYETVVEIRRLRGVAQNLVNDASKRQPIEDRPSFI
ncbi:MAG TPA: Clp protease N-terminal domain-containing protein [Nitrolancea sp.]|nr:Clp protease N-terminal domain-containing protein [Nitrolancea sp.]